MVLEARAEALAVPDLRAQVLAFVEQDEIEDWALRSYPSDSENYTGVRDATIEAYKVAQQAVGEALQRLDGPQV